MKSLLLAVTLCLMLNSVSSWYKSNIKDQAQKLVPSEYGDLVNIVDWTYGGDNSLIAVFNLRKLNDSVQLAKVLLDQHPTLIANLSKAIGSPTKSSADLQKQIIYRVFKIATENEQPKPISSSALAAASPVVNAALKASPSLLNAVNFVSNR